MPNESEQHERFLRLLLKDERRIRRYILALMPDRVDAADVMQETSLALWRKFDEYRPAQPFFNWAVRKGDWKLIRRKGNHPKAKEHFTLHNLADDKPEVTDYTKQKPDKVKHLLELYVSWQEDVFSRLSQ